MFLKNLKSIHKVIDRVSHVSLGEHHTCAVTFDNELYCFGNLDNPSVVCVKMQHLIAVKMKIII